MALDELHTDDATTELPAVGKHQRKRSRWVRAIVIGGIIVLVGAGSAVLGGSLMLNRYESKVERADILKDIPKPVTPPVADLSPLNFLVLGSDSRSPNARGFDATGDRSDTIMVLHIPQGRTSAFIFSIPRDSYVNVPPAGSWAGGLNKINAAMALGGAAHAARTVYELTKIPFDGAFVVNFGGIHRMVEVVGKIHVCIPYTVRSTFSRKVWEQGCHDMDPKETEEFMRQRMGTPAGDFARMYDQQLVVKALADQIFSAGIITNPVRLDHLISIAAESVTVDQNTNLRSLILDLKGISPENVKVATAPWSGLGRESAGSVVYLNMPAAQELFQAVIHDRTDAWLAAHPQGVPSWNPPST